MRCAGIDIAQRHVKEGREVVLLLAGRNGGDDRAKIQITKALRRDGLVFWNPVGRILKEDAPEGRETLLDERRAIIDPVLFAAEGRQSPRSCRDQWISCHAGKVPNLVDAENGDAPPAYFDLVEAAWRLLDAPIGGERLVEKLEQQCAVDRVVPHHDDAVVVQRVAFQRQAQRIR